MRKIILLLFMVVALASFSYGQKTIIGTVKDDAGEALIGATVIEQGTTNGTTSDIDGNFTISVKDPETAIIEIRYIGYETSTHAAALSDKIDAVLSTGKLLDEVVVIGYESVKKSDIVESVSTVGGEDLQLVPISSTDQLLQGRAAGVEATAINGKPGQQSYIRIRGLTSINGNNEPLYIINGVPMPSTVYAALNPNDVENISILKDAAATAIYGARASAGVVLVTTKSGAGKSSTVEYSIQFGNKQAVDDKVELMNAREKLDYEVALTESFETFDVRRAEEIDALLMNTTDWEDELLRTGSLMSHNLSFSGNNENGSYYASFSRFDEQGISVGSDFDRTTATFNGNYKINNWIKVSNNLNVSRRNDIELRDRFNVQSPFYGRYIYNPYETVFNYDENGDLELDENEEPTYNFTHQGFNIVEAIENNPESRRYSDIFGNLKLELEPIEGLLISSSGGYTFNTFKNEYFIKPGSILDGYVGDPDAPGIKRDSNNFRNRYNWINTAQYNFKVGEVNNITLIAGTEFVKDLSESNSISAKGFPANLSVQSVAAEITDGFTDAFESSLFSIFGSARYTFNDRLNFKATIRRDGSSRFGVENRYGTFYALGLGYDLAQESFLSSSMVDQLKLRVSYGTSGNEPVNRYDHLGVLSFASYNDQSSAFQSRVANPNLKWEEQKGFSAGLDFGLWGSRLSGSIEFYNKKSTDLLFASQLSRTTGFSSQIDNIGDLTNTGAELELEYRVFPKSPFDLNLGLNFTTNQSTIDKLNTEEEFIEPTNAFYSILKEGENAYVFRLVEFVGVNSDTGDLIYLDAEGNETNSPTASDSKILSGKSALPKYWGGFNIDLAYKGISLNTDFAFKGGNHIYNYKRYWLQRGLDGARSNVSVEAANYWQNPGDQTDIARPDLELEATESTQFLEKGDYLRLRNVQLAYSLPTSLLSKIKVQNVSFFIAGTNLLTFTNYLGDPEVGVSLEESVDDVGLALPGEAEFFSYPNTTSITGGLTFKF